jgi:hypothetical protein
MNTDDNSMTSEGALSFILHQDNLMWSRIQTIEAVQLAGLAASYTVRSQPLLAITTASLTALLTLLVFCLLRRDAMIQTELLVKFPQFEWSAPRKWDAPLKGREVTWLVLVILLTADILIGIDAELGWL